MKRLGGGAVSLTTMRGIAYSIEMGCMRKMGDSLKDGVIDNKRSLSKSPR